MEFFVEGLKGFVRKLFDMPEHLWDIEVDSVECLTFVSKQWEGLDNVKASVSIDLDSMNATIRVPPRNTVDIAVMKSKAFQRDVASIVAEGLGISTASVKVDFAFGRLFIQVPAKATFLPLGDFNNMIFSIYDTLDKYVAWVIDNIKPELIDAHKIMEDL